jgi:hypothetical protein
MFKFAVLLALAILGANGGIIPNAPPATWREHWFDHVQTITRVYADSDVAIYFDNDVDRSITWPNKYLGDVWRYVKRTYGNFGSESELYAIFHTAKYSGGHPSTFFDESHDYRNVIDCGSSARDAWLSGQGNDLDIVTHEVAHIVEGASKGVHGSPAFPIWGDSKWAEIFNYDVYLNLGMIDDANRWYNTVINGRENFPRANTYWFRDWFYPIYFEYGRTAVLNNFFTVLANNYARNGNEYRGDLNMGQFVHFWSGAAGRNLRSLAEAAFGWSQDYQNQFDQARRDYPNVNYS